MNHDSFRSFIPSISGERAAEAAEAAEELRASAVRAPRPLPDLSPP